MSHLTTVATVAAITTSSALSNEAGQVATDLHTSSFHKSQKAYHELNHQHVVELDVLEQLKCNLAQLDDLHGRMKYMMAELNYLLRKSSF